MSKRILYIIIGTILTIVLIVGLWFWFFGRGASEVAGPTGLFGTSDNKPTTSTGAGSDTGNGQAPIGSNVSGNVGGDTSGAVTYTTLNAGSGSGVTWLNGSGGGGSPGQGGSGGAGASGSAGAGASGSGGGGAGAGGGGGAGGGAGAGGGSTSGTGAAFSPTSINDVDTTSVYGTPYITAKPTEVGLGSSLAVLAAGCLATYTAERLIIGPATTGITTAVQSVANTILGLLFGRSTAGTSPLNPMFTSDSSVQSNTATETVSQCLVRTIGRLAIQKITQSTVDWINSGFEGKPAFVQDYNQFFADTADQAAGQFIQGSGLAFLCSPFQLKVRIAIAQSYAHRSSYTNSCTLSGVVGNIDKFVDGDFSEGGWQGLLSFTTMPTNNPFGAYMQAQVALEDAQGRAIQAGNTELTLGQGFLSVKQCDPAPAGIDDIAYNAGVSTQQHCKIVTPGRAIVSSFDATTQSTLDSLGMADSINDILGALSNALITKVLYGGLSNASSDSAPTEAQQQATTFFNTLQTYVQYAQQYGEVEQGSASDIQTSQAGLVALQNCWLSKSESSQAQDAAAQATDLEGDVGVYNNRITNANAVIAQVQQYQTRTLDATTPAEIQTIQNQFNATRASGTLIESAAITSAQQDRTSLQARLAIINSDTSAKLQQCYAS